MLGRSHIKPSFLIIGGVKCGTSSLYRYLMEHPNVLPCKTKEPDFLTSNNPLRLLQGLGDYWSLFPKKSNSGSISADWLDLNTKGQLEEGIIQKKIIPGERYITGEATAKTYCFANPYYVRALLPNARLIMMVRNPTERLYSHYQMLHRFVKDGKRDFDLPPFKEYVEDKLNRFKKGHRNIIRQGLYLQYLSKWEKVFGKERLSIFHIDELSNPAKANKTLTEVCNYLNIRDHDFSDILNKQFNKANYHQMNTEAQAILDEFYHPYNQAFQSHFGIEL